jgi:protein TonB
MEAKKNPTSDVHRYSNHFFLIGLGVSITLLIVAFEWRSEKKVLVRQPDEPPQIAFTLYPVQVTVLENVPTLKPLKKVVVVNPDRIVEVKDIIKISSPDIQIEPPEVSIDIDPNAFNQPVEVSIDTFFVVEKMPVPIGGLAGFYKQLSKSINYPNRAKQRQTEGKVIIEFVIDQSGNPINLKVLKGIGHGCDEEAMRVLQLAKWEPGKQRGQPVPVKMTLPIFFRLN